MSLRSPLGRVLGLGSAREGVGHWWALRLSSVALVPLMLWFLVSLAALGTLDHAVVADFLHAPFNAFLTLLLIGAMAYHSYLGVGVVVEDYVHAPFTRIVVLVVSRFVHLAAGAAAAFAVLRIVFGSPFS